MIVEKNVPLQAMNTFGIVAKAHVLMRVKSLDDLQAVAEQNLLGGKIPFVLGGGSNVVITGDIKAPVIRIEIPGIALVNETPKAWVVEAGAGVNWHDLVAWTLENGYPGLENLALIPGSVGASPVQNIGAYGVELQDRFDSLQAFDLATGRSFELRAEQCAFGYRDSVFKHTAAKEGDFGLAGRAIITSVRFLLPKNWKPEVDYADLSRKCQQSGIAKPTPRQIFDWVVAIRRAKLPDPAVIGNAGSFFKNPVVSAEQCADIIQREPTIVHYRLHDGTVKLAAGWLIDACGWRGKTLGNAGVYDKQALVLVNYGAAHHRQAATGGEVMTLAKAIQTSVYERFGLRLEPEPVVV
jgi:UDP-N-acetylmuramate dehydrogenase